MKCIELIDFSVYYKLKKEYLVALDQVSLTVEEGEFLTIIGPSGCGKSTLLKSILGQVELTEGKLLVRGEEMTDSSLKKANIAYISQEHRLYQHLNVYENIAFPLRMAEFDPEETDVRVRAMAERCGLPSGLLNRKPKQLSLGQQQRVALARAFVKKPGLVLADEPFSHLDPTLRQEFREWIRNYWEETRATFLLVTHDEEEARTMGGRLLQMDHGEIVSSEDTGQYGASRERKVVSSIPDVLLQKQAVGAKKTLHFRLQYRWPVYLLGLVALVFVISTLWERLTEPDGNEKLSVCFVGQNFLAEDAQEILGADMAAFTDQPLKELNVESLYNENGTLLAEALTVRCIGDTDFIILEEKFVFDEIGQKYFCEIPAEIVRTYFPNAEVYAESDRVYGVRIYSPQDGPSTLSNYYSGDQACWLFFTMVSENIAAFNGRGTSDDTAALDLAAYLWRANP